MWKIIPLSLLQSVLLTAGQLLFKLALDKAAPYEGIGKLWSCVKRDWYMWHGCWISLTVATLLWAYILRHFPFSVAYPLSCISFLLGIIAGAVFFDEQLSANKIIGIVVMMIGAFIIAK